MVLTKKEASEKLKISVKTLERKIADGSLIVHTIGRNIRIDENDLMSFWENCRKPLIEAGGAA